MVKNLNFIGIIMVFLVSCASAPEITQQQLQAKYASTSPMRAYDLAQIRIEKARQENLKFYAPQNYKQAQNHFSEAKALSTKTAVDSELLKQVYLVEKYLDDAQIVKQIVMKELDEQLDIKQLLLKKGVEKAFKKDYQEQLEQLADLIEEIESKTLNGKYEASKYPGMAKDKTELLGDMKQLEIKLVKHNHLNDAIQELAKAESLGAEKLAQKTYLQATQKLKQANLYIEEHVRNDEGVKRVGEQFQFAVRHAMHITDAVIRLQKLDKDRYEDYVLEHEGYLHKVSQALGEKDLRDHSIAEQGRQLATWVSRRRSEEEQLKSALKDSEHQGDSLAKKLNAEKNEAANQFEEYDKIISELQSQIAILEAERHQLNNNVARLESELKQADFAEGVPPAATESIDTASRPTGETLPSTPQSPELGQK